MKKQNNEYLDKINKQKARIGKMEREIADRDKIMQSFVLNTED